LPAHQLPPEALPSLCQFSVEQYLLMAKAGVFAKEQPVELISGWVVQKMVRYPPHDGTLGWLNRWFGRQLPEDWLVRCQMALVLARSVPEPDLAITRGPAETYFQRHPQPRDTALTIEVSEDSLLYDRTVKAALYAEARLAEYWVVNVVDLQVEVYTQPKAGKAPGYRHRQDYGCGKLVPVILDGKEIGRIKIAEMFAPLASR
jgi:Uma2 family endonuclease